MYFSFYDQDIPAIILSNHYSFENGITFILIVPTYGSVAQKVRIGVKNLSAQVHFFLEYFCTPALRELDQHIWQIISELVLFRQMIIRTRQDYGTFVLGRGG